MIDKFCNPSLPSNNRKNIVKIENDATETNSHQQQKSKNLQSPQHNNNNNGIRSSLNNHNGTIQNLNNSNPKVELEVRNQLSNTNSSNNHHDVANQSNKLIINYPTGPVKSLGKNELYPPTPSIFVQTESEIFSPQLQEFCLAHPIVNIRNISRVLKLNLGLFSTKTLVDIDAGHKIEVRTQLEQPSDQNWDPEKKDRIWRCESPRNWSTIGEHAEYQAITFRNHLSKIDPTISEDFTVVKEDSNPSFKRNPNFKYVTFGTNVDLSDSKKWKPQLDELDKLPIFSRVASASNMLSHVGYPILGMNTVQLYMKVPGCRTPGHQENNNFCSVNINIGPGDCEWFGVAEEYWGPMAKLCAENGTNFVHGSWWPNLEDLEAYSIPVYRFIQKPGDLVWVNTGTVHWVQAIGWCNNIAWNVGPMTTKQFKSAIERYEWNRLERYKSIVPMIHLTWNLVKNVEVHDEDLFRLIKETMTISLSYCERLIKQLGDCNIQIRWHGKGPNEPAHYCYLCEIEVFNILFVKAKKIVHCAKCAIEISQVLENFVVLQEYDMDYLKETYLNFTRTFESQRKTATLPPPTTNHLDVKQTN